MCTEFKNDYNQRHFVRNETFKVGGGEGGRREGVWGMEGKERGKQQGRVGGEGETERSLCVVFCGGWQGGDWSRGARTHTRSQLDPPHTAGSSSSSRAWCPGAVVPSPWGSAGPAAARRGRHPHRGRWSRFGPACCSRWRCVVPFGVFCCSWHLQVMLGVSHRAKETTCVVVTPQPVCAPAATVWGLL
jgi:hypothetical protein